MDAIKKVSEVISNIYNAASTVRSLKQVPAATLRLDRIYPTPDPAASIIPWGILAFRTITLLLSKIAQKSFTYVDNTKDQIADEREQIKDLECYRQRSCRRTCCRCRYVERNA